MRATLALLTAGALFAFAPAASAEESGAGASDATDPEEQAAFAQINQERGSRGLQPLSISPTLTTAARWLGHDLAERGELDHTDSLGRDLRTRLTAFGYTPQSAIFENLGAGFERGPAVVAGWMDSAGHRANLLAPAARTAGLARVPADGPYAWYWVLDLGSVEEAPVPTTGTRTALLAPGWNLVSWSGAGATIGHLSASLPENVDRLAAWDAAENRWRTYLPRPGIGDLGELAAHAGLWVHVAGDRGVQWHQPSQSTAARTIPLRPGWQIVTWTGPSHASASAAFGEASAAVDTIALFDASSGRFQLSRIDGSPLDRGLTLETGAAFWVHVRDAASWTQPAAG